MSGFKSGRRARYCALSIPQVLEPIADSLALLNAGMTGRSKMFSASMHGCPVKKSYGKVRITSGATGCKVPIEAVQDWCQIRAFDVPRHCLGQTKEANLVYLLYYASADGQFSGAVNGSCCYLESVCFTIFNNIDR